jgi:poly(A) polymerase
VYGNLEQDAIRRDFTVNALYFNPADDSIIDFSHGWEDFQSRTLRLIGEPKVRYQEDPIRLLRAIRFLTKLNFHLEADTQKPVADVLSLLAKMPPARMFDEYTKLFLHGHGVSNFKALCEFGAFEYLFPHSAKYVNHPQYKQLFLTALHNTDARILEQKGVNPAFLISVFLWPVMQDHLKQETGNPYHNLHYHMAMVVSEQLRATAMPRRFSHTIKEIWELQRPLESRKPKHVERVITHPRFRAAYDFLLLRSQIHEVLPTLAAWWTEFQAMTPENQTKAIKSLRGKK